METVTIKCTCCEQEAQALYDGRFATCHKCGYVNEVLPSEWMKGMSNKYCGIFKHEDAVKYLNDREKAELNHLCNKIELSRKRDGKRGVNAYLVINVDEPYAEEVSEILKRHGHWG